MVNLHCGYCNFQKYIVLVLKNSGLPIKYKERQFCDKSVTMKPESLETLNINSEFTPIKSPPNKK